jgi:hypothetical protein
MFAHPDGDHMTLLNVFRGFAATLPHDVYKSPFTKQSRGGSSSSSSGYNTKAARSWCDEHFLSLKVLERATEIRARLSGMLYTFFLQDKSKAGTVLASSHGSSNESALIRRYCSVSFVLINNGIMICILINCVLSISCCVVWCGVVAAGV